MRVNEEFQLVSLGTAPNIPRIADNNKPVFSFFSLNDGLHQLSSDGKEQKIIVKEDISGFISGEITKTSGNFPKITLNKNENEAIIFPEYLEYLAKVVSPSVDDISITLENLNEETGSYNFDIVLRFTNNYPLDSISTYSCSILNNNSSVQTIEGIKSDESIIFNFTDIAAESEYSIEIRLSTIYNTSITKKETISLTSNINVLSLDPVSTNKINADWNETDENSESFIFNKPTKLSEFENDEKFITEDDFDSLKISLDKELQEIQNSKTVTTVFRIKGEKDSLEELEDEESTASDGDIWIIDDIAYLYSSENNSWILLKNQFDITPLTARIKSLEERLLKLEEKIL